MAWQTIGVTALLLGSIAPALAQGPMSPVQLSPSAFEVTTEVPRAPAPPVPPPTVLPNPAATLPSTNAASRTKRSKTLTALDAPAKTKDSDLIAGMRSDAAVDDASDAGKPSKKRKSTDAASPSSARVDPDHMASMLNRLRLSGGSMPDEVGPSLRPAAGD